MWAVITNFLAAIPGIGGIVTSITSTVFNAKVSMLAARTGATRDVAVQAIQSAALDYQTRGAMLATIAGNKLLTWLIIAFAVPIVLFEAKVVVWDTMLGLGTTPAIHGQVADWMNTIINWLFGASTVLAAGHVFANTISKE